MGKLWIVFPVVVSILILGIVIPDSEALKSSGTPMLQTNSQMVCGDHMCDNPMSIQEKIMMYLFGTEPEDTPTQSPTFSFGGVLPKYCNDMTIDELINSGSYNVIDNRAKTSAQDLRGSDVADLYLASNYGDKFNGENGDDCIIGGNGDDQLEGKSGNDMIFGSGGNDRLKGQNGDDYLNGGPGDDFLDGFDGIDTCVSDEEDSSSTRNCETEEPIEIPGESSELTVTTRDPSYLFGDSVRVEGTVPGVTSGQVTINIIDPNGEVAATMLKNIRSDSTFSEGFGTKNWTLSGTYTVEVTYGTLSGHTTFSFIIDTDSDGLTYVDGGIDGTWEITPTLSTQCSANNIEGAVVFGLNELQITNVGQDFAIGFIPTILGLPTPTVYFVTPLDLPTINIQASFEQFDFLLTGTLTSDSSFNGEISITNIQFDTRDIPNNPYKIAATITCTDVVKQVVVNKIGFESDNDGDGFSLADGDCDDTDPQINPGATEILDGVDNDCNGQIDEGVVPEEGIDGTWEITPTLSTQCWANNIPAPGDFRLDELQITNVGQDFIIGFNAKFSGLPIPTVYFVTPLDLPTINIQASFEQFDFLLTGTLTSDSSFNGEISITNIQFDTEEYNIPNTPFVVSATITCTDVVKQVVVNKISSTI
jgi:Ca2+-binding RTX toxin-like protein